MIAADRELPSSARATRSPFVRLTELLTGVEPGKPPINLTVGEPQHPIPPFVGEVVQKSLKDFGRYPPTKGSERFRRAAAGWLERRFALPRGLDVDSELTALNGTREGLFLAALTAKDMTRKKDRPAILVPNPFYAAYVAGAVAAGCEPVFLPAGRATHFLPDLDALDEALLKRTVAVYFGSPSNPQGAVADLAYLKRLVELARRHDFLIFSDECYSEIYTREAPPGMLQAAGGDFSHIVVFNSLSKRSNLPGIRVGICVGDKAFITKFVDYRNVVAPQVPGPLQDVAAAAYSDEAHVEENRRLYRLKYDLADQIIGDRYGYERPAGGFFLWLDVAKYGGSEKVALKLWREGGVRILPGGYLAREQADGSNPGADFIRVAMVQDQEITAEALHRIVAVLD
ncbi:MAG TPA: aminotransferase class I/II-fold pyridoxal phosphate-dependent enzyme [Xanthobacteraceae bacterium]|nr:aminotransferase class I/II-fold pyridoxal phosphate-dependent enzyme [Xanthobacteraceae bacterium]